VGGKKDGIRIRDSAVGAERDGVAIVGKRPGMLGVGRAMVGRENFSYVAAGKVEDLGHGKKSETNSEGRHPESK